MIDIMNLIKNTPIPISGLILALLSLGNLTHDIHPTLRYIFGTLGVVFLILIILKVILYPQDIKTDFKNPVIVSSSGTFSMSVMLLSNTSYHLYQVLHILYGLLELACILC